MFGAAVPESAAAAAASPGDTNTIIRMAMPSRPMLTTAMPMTVPDLNAMSSAAPRLVFAAWVVRTAERVAQYIPK